MDIEQLTKSQIVLLTLLVSFVTSIATGIVTVSLMDQAPPAIAQTVNRVIERTVETVVPNTKGQTATTVITQEKTVVVKESELISKAVERTAPSIVRLYTSDNTTPTFLGLGVIIDGKGAIVSDTGALGERSDAVAALSDGTRVRVFVTRRVENAALAYLQAATSTETAPAWAPVVVATNHAVLGESVVALSGRSVLRIAPGVVTAIPQGAIAMIETTISGDSLLDGSPIIDTDGNLVGLSTSASRSVSGGSFVSASLLLSPAHAE